MKSVFNSLLLIFLCGLISDSPSQAQKQTSRQHTSLSQAVSRKSLGPELEKKIPQLMTLGDVPGLSIALIRDARVTWHKGFGVQNAETNGAITDRTVFEAASLSKPVFAYAVLKLIDSGKLELDKSLAAYLPAPYLPDDDRIKSITARMVLDHTTGFPNEASPRRPLKIYFSPGEKFSYSGEGFLYLQKVVEQITGEPLETFMQKSVFGPLGMTSSSFVWQHKYAAVKANGHKSSGAVAPVRKPTVARSYSGLHTTVVDYARFVIAVLNGTGLKRETIAQMHKAQVRLDESCYSCIENSPGRVSRTLSWGLGWGVERTEDGDALWHWGDNNNEFQHFVLAYPGEKVGVVILTNSGNGLSIIPEIVSQITGRQHASFAWMRYEPYNSAAKVLFRDVLNRGAVALAAYRESRGKGAASLDENQMNRLGYWLLGKNKIKEAVEIFKLNVEDFPNSANVYDSLGEAYMIDGDKESAIKNYERSLQLDPQNSNAVDMLRKLRGQ